jgi:regulatory protein
MFDVNFQNAKQVLENYCAYQERCSYEVYKKLSDFNLNEKQKNLIVIDLQKGNYFSDVRFCSAVVSGKFRMNKWGRLKIQAYLKQKNLPEALICNALNELDENEYFSTIGVLYERKSQEIKEKDTFKKHFKVVRYLLSKGFEYELIKEFVNSNS